MSPSRRPYLVLLGGVLAAIVALVVVVTVVWNYRPPGESVSVVPTQQPTAGAGPDSSGANTPAPGESPTPGSEITPDPGPTPAATPGVAKQTTSGSVNQEELTGYVWPLRKALITGRMAPREFGAFLI